MPASTVTVRASGSKATTRSIGFKERNPSVLLAMSLKQWRVPRIFSFLSFLTRSCTRCSEFAVLNCSVPYWRLPAQFLSLSPRAGASNGERTGLARAAEQSLGNVLLFMDVIGRVAGTSIERLLISWKDTAGRQGAAPT